ncbi:MAG TPA: type II secretion system F family protein [Gaiellaceae bacterium]
MRRLTPVLLATLALAAPAAAAASIQVKGVDMSGYPTIRLSVVTPGALSAAPSLEENGSRVAGFQAENLGRSKSVVLAVDRSKSMAGQSLEDATAAARAFVAAKPDADRIGIVTFGHKPVLLAPISPSTGDAEVALRDVAVDGTQGTALYDAVVLAAQSLADEEYPGRVLVLLTDGKDVSSHATLKRAVKEARAAGVAIYPIGILGKGFSPAPLQRLARLTGGTYYAAASTGTLRKIYASIAAELSRTWRISYLTTARPGDKIRLRASVPGLGSATQRLTIPGSADNGGDGGSGLLPGVAYTSSLGTLFLTLVVGLLVLLAAGTALAAQKGSWLRGRLEAHISPAKAKKAEQGERERLAFAGGLFKATESAFGHLRHWRAIQRLLERADVPLRVVEFVWITIVTSFVFALMAAVSGVSSLLILVALAFGAVLPLGFIWFKANRRLRAIEDSLPDLLITIAASLKAGHSFRQGLQTVVDEGDGPAAKEFKRVLTETRLGRPMDDALAEMAERVGSPNLEFVMTAVTIQRQIGGSLAGLFDMVAEAVRNRQQFARKIRSLTAMGRMSAYVLIGLPFFIAAMLTLLNPNYMSPLYSTHMGHILIVVGLVMMGFGSLILKKIVSFKG